MNTSSTIGPFLKEFWHFDRRATLQTLALNLAAALLEGLGLLMLLPLLHLAGLFGEGQGAALSLPMPSVVTGWINGIAPDRRLLLMLALFVSLIVLQSVVMRLRERQSLLLQLRFVDHLRDTLFGALARSRWSFLSRHHSSEFLSVLTADVSRVGMGALYLLQLFTRFSVFPVYLAVAFHLSPPVTALALVTGAGLWWLLRKSREASKRSGAVLSQANQGLFNEIQEFLGALKLIKIHGEEEGYRRQFSHVITNLRQHLVEFQAVSNRSQMAYRIGGAVALAALTYVSIAIVRMPGVSLLVLIAVFSRMLPQVSSIHMSLQQLWHMAPAFDNWHRWVLACAAEAEPVQNDSAAAPINQGIGLRGVLYQHPAGNLRFEAPELFIPAHRTTAIIGPTGSGKTTLLDLLSGLTAPDAGTIEVDGQALASRAGWRRQIAYVPQETAILDGTVRENLTWGAADADDARMMAALGQAAAADFVRALPQGLDTWVGERGVRLSGGEKQRLALARALLRSPQLLILDEATSALDREHQQVIFQALQKLHGRMTVLIVTHRFAEISNLLDGVVRVDAGRIGPWAPHQKS